jgi:hypothetical protein
MQDFWRSSGFRFVTRDVRGQLVPSDEFLRLYLQRPELAPVEESCLAERALRDLLIANPRATVEEARLGAITDSDARENYRVWLRFRDRLLAVGTLEAFYLRHFLNRSIDVPPLFLDHVAQIILRGMLDGSDDAILVRTAELFFRRQTLSLQDGAVLLGDADTIEMYQDTGGFGNVGRLLAQAETPLRQLNLEVLNVNNAVFYWMRDERFDTVLDLTPGREGMRALCRLLEKWVLHFLAVALAITPLTRVDDERWVWHVGLDAESTAILNDLYNGLTLEEECMRRLIGLFSLEFMNPAEMRADIAGRPVYLGLAISEAMTLKMKPQNLLLNLPLAQPA